jgi:hypothetical protein
MNPDPAQLLAQLTDIHGTGAPGWWPPASGWWVLALLVLAGVLLALRFLAQRLAVRRRRRRLLAALESFRDRYDPQRRPQAFLAAVNRLLRAVALRAFPGSGCARLQGSEWVEFIEARLPDGAPSECLAVLACGPYKPDPSFDPEGMMRLAGTWVRHYG